MGVDNPGRRSGGPEWARRDDFDEHRSNVFAHGEMINRIMQENVSLRERFENRLGALERFRAQATLLGGLGAIILGALASVVAIKLLG